MADSEINSSLSGFDNKVKLNLNESNETELIVAQSNSAASSFNTPKQPKSPTNKKDSLVMSNRLSSARYILDKDIAAKVDNPN